MPEKKGKYLSLEMLPAPVQGSIPSPSAAQDVLWSTTSLLGPGPITCPPCSMSLALLPSRSCQRAQIRCCFCWAGSLLFLLAESSEMAQLWWSWQGAEGMGKLLLPVCPTLRSLDSCHLAQ